MKKDKLGNPFTLGEYEAWCKETSKEAIAFINKIKAERKLPEGYDPKTYPLEDSVRENSKKLLEYRIAYKSAVKLCGKDKVRECLGGGDMSEEKATRLLNSLIDETEKKHSEHIWENILSNNQRKQVKEILEASNLTINDVVIIEIGNMGYKLPYFLAKTINTEAERYINLGIQYINL